MQWHPTNSVHLKSGLIRAVASLEDDNLVVFYYHSASQMWSDKLREGPEKRVNTVSHGEPHKLVLTNENDFTA